MNDDLNQGFFTGKRLLIFGAGYVGGAVAKAFIAEGGAVTAVTRNSPKALALSKMGVEAVVGDLVDGNWAARITGRPEFVLNCVSSGGGGLDGYRHSYLEGAKTIARWAKETEQSGHLVYTGSTSVYAQGDGMTVDESMLAESSEERALVLLETESRVKTWTNGWTILRLAGIYGPQRHYLLDGLRAGRDAVPGNGETQLNLVHRDDIVAAILRVYSIPQVSMNKVFNLVDNGCATKGEIVRWLCSQLQRDQPTFTGRSAPGRRRFMPSRIISNEKLKAELGWSPKFPSYREGYRDLLGA